MLPDKDLVLPSMHAMERRETVFVLACADRDGAAVLENRIRGQLNAGPQIANSCTHRIFCIPLPGVPVEVGPIDKQLEWISERIKSAVLQACTA
jgi:hypothetical protein